MRLCRANAIVVLLLLAGWMTAQSAQAQQNYGLGFRFNGPPPVSTRFQGFAFEAQNFRPPDQRPIQFSNISFAGPQGTLVQRPSGPQTPPGTVASPAFAGVPSGAASGSCVRSNTGAFLNPHDRRESVIWFPILQPKAAASPGDPKTQALPAVAQNIPAPEPEKAEDELRPFSNQRLLFPEAGQPTRLLRTAQSAQTISLPTPARSQAQKVDQAPAEPIAHEPSPIPARNVVRLLYGSNDPAARQAANEPAGLN